MKINICEICYYESNHREPKLEVATNGVSLRLGPEKIKLDVCKKHSDFLTKRKGKSLQAISKELSEMRDKFYDMAIEHNQLKEAKVKCLDCMKPEDECKCGGSNVKR